MQETLENPDKPVPESFGKEPLWLFLTLCLLSIALHGQALFFPDQFIFSPADILGRQPELGGDSTFTPSNRLLIDPVLQFQVWDQIIRGSAGRQESDADGQASDGDRSALFWNSYSGGGAPLAGNGQSRVFDPVHRFFLLFPLPWAWAAESAARFVWTGLGFYLFCRSAGLSRTVRLWCPVALSLTGFFTLWRQYPLVATGSICPWMLWAFLEFSQKKTVGRWVVAGLSVALLLVSGNVQIAAVCLLMLLLFMATVIIPLARKNQQRISTHVIGAGSAIFIGILIAAPAWISLVDYLLQSPIWADRIAEHSGTGRGVAARWRDLPCLIAPFIYGSERAGDANLHKAIGAGNVNEAASGYIGVIALLCLIPSAFGNNPTKHREMFRFSCCLAIASLIISYRLPPVNWLWPHLPVLQGIDPRRFVIGVPIGGILIAGFGLEQLHAGRVSDKTSRWLRTVWLLMVPGFILAATLPFLFQAKIRSRAEAHYSQIIPPGPNQEKLVVERVNQQIQAITGAWPSYMIGRSILLAILLCGWSVLRHTPRRRANCIALLAVLELVHFGWRYNPQIESKWHDFGRASVLISRLKSIQTDELRQGHEARFLALGEFLPPNELMRFGLKDVRNYDSIETLQSLTTLADLYEPSSDADRTSRRDADWSGVARAKEALKDFGMVAVVGPTEPPAGLFDGDAERVSDAWIGRWSGRPRLVFSGKSRAELVVDEPGRIEVRINADAASKTTPEPRAESELRTRESFRVREIWQPGWHVTRSDFADVTITADRASGFINLEFSKPQKNGTIRLDFRPEHWQVAKICCFSGILALLVVACRAIMKGSKKAFKSLP